MTLHGRISGKDLRRREPRATPLSTHLSSPRIRSPRGLSRSLPASSHPKDILPTDIPVPTAKNDIPSTVESLIPYSGFDIQPIAQRIWSYVQSRIARQVTEQSPGVMIGSCLPQFLNLVNTLSVDGDQRVRDLAQARLEAYNLSQEMLEDLDQLLDLAQIRGKLTFIRHNPHHPEVTQHIIDVRQLIEDEHNKAMKKYN